MRVSWLNTLLLVTISLPPDGSAAPCSEKRFSVHSLFNREAAAAIPPIVPVPKPVVPVINPFPITPKPISPKPISPKPVSPKPVEPVQPNPGSAVRCKRAPGDPCSNVATFKDPELEEIRNKGRLAQADLLAVQRANPPAQDVDRASLAEQYTHQEPTKPGPPLPDDESEFLRLGNSQVPYSSQDWHTYTTANKQGSGGKVPESILKTHVNGQDRVMIIAESFNKNYDQLESGKMHWSDMAMHDLKLGFGIAGVRPDQLKYMVRHSIGGGSSASDTQHFIDQAIKITEGKKANVNTFRSDPYAPGITPKELAAYQLLSGSDHVHRVLLMLKDYPATMKNVRVESLRVYTPETPGTDDGYHIVIMFTRVDNP